MRYLLALSLALFACRSDEPGGGGTDGGSNGPDAPDGVGCTALAPRSVEPEAFVGPTGLQPRLVSLIDSAQESIEVQIYLFTVTAIADRLIAAKDRGVAVRVLFDPDHEGNANVRGRLNAASVSNRNMPTLYTFSHAKFIIVDHEKVAIMSMNFNADAMTDERNYGIIDADPEDVADAIAIFEMDWAAGGGEPPKPADLVCTRLVVSPNNAKQRILAHINSAMQTLDVEALYVSEETVRTAIGQAKSRGATVRVILEPSMDDAESIAYFKGLGIEVHGAQGFYLHAKLLVADGVAFVGSENFSQTSLTRNRELGALVFEPGPAQIIRTQFETDWANTPTQ